MIYGNWNAWDENKIGVWRAPISEKRTMDETGRELASAHVEWLLGMLRPLLIDHMQHGFKHGVEWERGYKNVGSVDRGCADRDGVWGHVRGDSRTGQGEKAGKGE